MLKIYTPKEWSSFFGGTPSLYIKDDGYIYTREEEVKIAGRPCGLIDYRRGRIYGKDYGSVNPDPIGYLQEKDGVTEIYAQLPGWNVKPILVIVGNEIYPYSEYIRICGGRPSGYIEDTDKGKEKGGTTQTGSGTKSDQAVNGTNRGQSGHSHPGSSNSGCLGEFSTFAVLIGIFIVLMMIDEIRKAGASFFIPFGILSGLMFLVRYLRKKKERSGETPPAEPVTPAPATPKPTPAPKKPVPKAEPKPAPKSVPKPEPKPVPKPEPTPVEEKKPHPVEKTIAVCPHCGAKCRVPVGVGTIQIPCPNPKCKTPFIFTS